jgi:hypothetical protein
MAQIKKAAAFVDPNASLMNEAQNPLGAAASPDGKGAADEDDDPESGISLAFKRNPKKEKVPNSKEGYLMKKSPNIMTGWQKRFFVLKDPGDIFYYETVSVRVPHRLYSCNFLAVAFLFVRSKPTQRTRRPRVSSIALRLCRTGKACR